MSNLWSEVQNTIERLKGEKRAKNFSPFIDFIQFSQYRNFQKDLKVTFDFPLTVVVGANGTGKSSLLHALYGAPSGHQPGDWWFGTAVDPTGSESPEGGRKRKTLKEPEKAAFWYQYEENGVKKQPLKMRIRREGDPDYWEPSRPIKRYGMRPRSDNGRDPVVNMDALYMNFKTQIGAFDRCFYFKPPEAISRVERSAFWKNIRLTAKGRTPKIQDYLRWRSRRLKRVLVEGKTLKRGQYAFHKPRIALTTEELNDISFIVGRTYSEGFMVEHRFYETWGVSVMFSTDQLRYSDASAGSGESAVVRLVHEIFMAKSGQLVLLDEPETSLHPGAQERLLAYLLKATAEKKLQVVISTHSPSFVRLMPREAIRVMSIDRSGKVQVAENVNPDEAFHVIGHPPESVVHLIVEDRLSKHLVEAVLGTQEAGFRAQFMVDFQPGGESGMKQDAAIFMRDPHHKRHFLFDGDKQVTVEQIDISDISITTTSKDLDQIIKKHYGTSVDFRQDSNMPEEEKRKLRLQYVDFANKRFHALPFLHPEQAIWDDDRAKKQLAVVGCPPTDYKEIEAEQDFKKKFKILTRLAQPDGFDLGSGEISMIHKVFIKAFCTQDSATKSEIIDLLKEIANDAGVY